MGLDRVQWVLAAATLPDLPVILVALATRGLLSALGVDDGFRVSVGMGVGVELAEPVGVGVAPALGPGVGFLAEVREQVAFGVAR